MSNASNGKLWIVIVLIVLIIAAAISYSVWDRYNLSTELLSLKSELNVKIQNIEGSVTLAVDTIDKVKDQLSSITSLMSTHTQSIIELRDKTANKRNSTISKLSLSAEELGFSNSPQASPKK